MIGAEAAQESLAANPLYVPAGRGRIVHAVLGRLAAEFPPSPARIDAVVYEAVRETVRASIHRIALRACLGSTCHRYFDAFPPPAGSCLAGRELPVGGGRLDLLWELPDRRLLGDEVKTGALSGFDHDLVSDQLARQLAGARDRFGDRFVGIRLIRLNQAAGHLLLSPEASTVPLTARRRHVH